MSILVLLSLLLSLVCLQLLNISQVELCKRNSEFANKDFRLLQIVVDKTALTAEQLAAAFANTMTNKTMNGTAHGNTTAPGVPGDASKPNNAIAINAAFGAVFGGAVLAVIVGAL